MKVCVTGLRGLPKVMGGVETHCEELYPRMKALMPEVDFEVLGRRPYVSPEPYVFEGLRITPIAAFSSKYLEAISHTFLAVLYARFVARADLLHIHAIGPGVLAPLAKMLGLKVLVTHHGQDYRRAKWNRVARTVLHLGEWCSIASADRVIVVASTLSGELKLRYASHEAKIEYVPNGMLARVVSAPAGGGAGPLDRLGLAPGRYVLAVGRLVPEKGFHHLIEAFAAASPDLKLVIAGAANHEDRYSRSLLDQAGERIIFAGALYQEELAELYRNAALFVLPSVHEGLPITVLEAVSFGAPVLISDIGPNLDIGLPERNYFPVNDVAALSERLAGSFDDLRVDTAAVASRFNWDEIASRTVAVYRACGFDARPA